MFAILAYAVASVFGQDNDPEVTGGGRHRPEYIEQKQGISIGNKVKGTRAKRKRRSAK